MQAQILERIKSFEIKKLISPDISLDIISHFQPSRDQLVQFLDRVFPQSVTPSLEDVFTLLDQTIEARGCCSGLTWEELEAYRSHLKRTVLFTFHSAGEEIQDEPRKFYHSVATYLVRQRIFPGQESDPVSIVSLNWDSVLEDSIYWCINEIDARGRIDIDYCCYTTPLVENIPHTPSTQQKALGMFNIKLMKVHGSANWLYCPNCNRLFTGVGGDQSVWELYVKERKCRICSEQYSRMAESSSMSAPILEPFFISPTYVKKFDNPHIQMTWHNAFLDLSDATNVVFIGYSLPEADYHVRNLLRRSICRDANILVVLPESARQKRNTPKRLAGYLPESRYKDFFGENRVEFDFSGVEGYFSRLLGGMELPKRIRYLKGLLTRRTAK